MEGRGKERVEGENGEGRGERREERERREGREEREIYHREATITGKTHNLESHVSVEDTGVTRVTHRAGHQVSYGVWFRTLGHLGAVHQGVWFRVRCGLTWVTGRTEQTLSITNPENHAELIAKVAMNIIIKHESRYCKNYWSRSGCYTGVLLYTTIAMVAAGICQAKSKCKVSFGLCTLTLFPCLFHLGGRG